MRTLFRAVRFGWAIYSHMRKAKNRAALLRALKDAVRDGEISRSEWMGLGNRLGLK